MMDVIFEANQGGAPVTIKTPEGVVEIVDFMWCPLCDEFHVMPKIGLVNGFRAVDEAV